jgi:hypothetical protein
MSDSNYEFEDEVEDQATRKDPVRARMRELEQQVKAFEAKAKEAEAAQRELAFVKAGVNPDSAAAKYFVKGYDGDLTPEAIRAAAEEAQLITPQPVQVDPDKAAWQQSNRIAAGAETASEGPSWVKRIRDAESAEEISNIFAEAQAQGINLG